MSSSGNASGAGAGSSSSSSSSTASLSTQNTTKTITEEDKKARELVEQFSTFLKWYQQRDLEVYQEENSYDNLIITVGIAKHSYRLQLKFLFDMAVREDLFDLNSLNLNTVMIHFDEEFNKPRPGNIYQRSKKNANIGDLYNKYTNFTLRDFGKQNDSYINSDYGSYVSNLELFNKDDMNDTFFKTLPEELNDFVANRNRNLYKNLFSLQLFVPYNLVSYYTSEDKYGNIKRMKEKKTLLEAGKDCIPLKGSTYEALKNMINTFKFKKIYIYNAAYWKTQAEIKNNVGKAKLVDILQNQHFEGMCELLNIVKDSDAKKYIFDTEFENLRYSKLARNQNRNKIFDYFNYYSKMYPYTHTLQHKIKSFPSKNESISIPIGTLYPLNETTAFKGGKRKTQKLRKIKKRTYKNRL